MEARSRLLPVALAALATALNAAKPVGIDDQPYLVLAEQVARDPADPYGCTQFVYDRPQPANEVLAPLALPYWLGLGIALFGDDPVRLKLWLFPVLLLLTVSLHALLRRFARGLEAPLLTMAVLSPTVLPGINLMLDVPASALTVAAVALFLRAAGRNSPALAVAAGAVAALAMQTKYTGLVSVPVLVGSGIVYRRPLLGLLAAAVAVGLLAGWE